MSEKTVKFNWVPTPKQQIALNNKAFELLTGGAKNGGKTQFLCAYLFHYCMKYVGARCVLGRKKFSMLRRSAWKTFQTIVPAATYEYNGTEHEVRFHNGSTITLTALDSNEDLNRFSGVENDLVCIEEAQETDEEHYINLKMTLKRSKNRKFPPKLIATANPAMGFIRNNFILSPIPGQREFIQFLPSDNTFADPEYVPMLRESLKHFPHLIRAWVDGSWDVIENSSAIIQHSKAIEASHRTEQKAYFDKKVVSIDVARMGDDETVIYGWHGTKIVEHQEYGKKDLDVTAARAVMMQKRIGANCIIWDADGLGQGLMSHLKELVDEGVTLIEFHGSGDTDNPIYFNQRAEAWFEAAELFNNDLMSIPDDAILVGQLPAVNYDFKVGKMIVESKKVIKEDLGKSPDRGDALVYGCYALKRAPSLFIQAPIPKGSMNELLKEFEETEEEAGSEGYHIGNHSVDKW